MTMTALPFSERKFMQICWLVPDLEAAIDNWVRSTGVGPFFTFSGVSFVDGHYRGQPADFPDVTAAIAYSGDLQIEFVCQNNDQRPSIFRDVFPQGQYGLHHMGLVCDDYDAELAAYLESGAELAFEGRLGKGLRTCWIDTVKTLGFMVELLEGDEGRAAHFAKWRDAAIDWDGKDPIRKP